MSFLVVCRSLRVSSLGSFSALGRSLMLGASLSPCFFPLAACVAWLPALLSLRFLSWPWLGLFSFFLFLALFFLLCHSFLLCFGPLFPFSFIYSFSCFSVSVLRLLNSSSGLSLLFEFRFFLQRPLPILHSISFSPLVVCSLAPAFLGFLGFASFLGLLPAVPAGATSFLCPLFCPFCLRHFGLPLAVLLSASPPFVSLPVLYGLRSSFPHPPPALRFCTPSVLFRAVGSPGHSLGGSGAASRHFCWFSFVVVSACFGFFLVPWAAFSPPSWVFLFVLVVLFFAPALVLSPPGLLALLLWLLVVSFLTRSNLRFSSRCGLPLGRVRLPSASVFSVSSGLPLLVSSRFCLRSVPLPCSPLAFSLCRVPPVGFFLFLGARSPSEFGFASVFLLFLPLWLAWFRSSFAGGWFYFFRCSFRVLRLFCFFSASLGFFLFSFRDPPLGFHSLLPGSASSVLLWAFSTFACCVSVLPAVLRWFSYFSPVADSPLVDRFCFLPLYLWPLQAVVFPSALFLFFPLGWAFFSCLLVLLLVLFLIRFSFSSFEVSL